MFCPKCGSENQPDLKFCTRCGANLAIISDAITGKPTEKLWPDDSLIEILKKYYDGKRSTAVGAGSMFIGLVFAITLLKLNISENLTGVLLNAVAGCALVYGAIAIISGIARWIESSSQLKALGYDKPENAIPKSPKPIAELSSASTVINVKKYDTDSINMPVKLDDSTATPPSVTEQTTRQLEKEGEKTSQPDKVLY
nr:hypothetical protein [uncultured bacterium]